MYNLFIALAAAVITFLAFMGLFSPVAAIFPAIVALVAVYFLLARRSLKQLEAILLGAQKDLAAQRVEPALARIREGFPLAKWQFLVAGQLHAQLGMVLYMLKRFDEAQPHLEKSFGRIGQARAMLGSLHFMKKDYDGMERVFEEAVRVNKKDGFLWSVYAFCLHKAGRTEKALAALSRGVDASPQDERLKANQLALQNEKRLKMKAYGNEWWIFHLEKPPANLGQGMHPGIAARRGYRNFRR